jgi:hypothetical protein
VARERKRPSGQHRWARCPAWAARLGTLTSRDNKERCRGSTILVRRGIANRRQKGERQKSGAGQPDVMSTASTSGLGYYENVLSHGEKSCSAEAQYACTSPTPIRIEEMHPVTALDNWNWAPAFVNGPALVGARRRLDQATAGLGSRGSEYVHNSENFATGFNSGKTAPLCRDFTRWTNRGRCLPAGGRPPVVQRGDEWRQRGGRPASRESTVRVHF